MFIVDNYDPLWPCLLPISSFSTVHGLCVLFFLTADNTSGARVQEHYLKTTEMVRQCEENERGTHSENKARYGHTRENTKRYARAKVTKYE